MSNTPNPIPENKPSKPFPASKPDMPNADISKQPSTDAENRVEREADKAAHKAAKTEQEYDSQHSTISK